MVGHLTDDELRTLCVAMKKMPVANANEVIQQGETGDKFYVVTAGTFELFVDRAGDTVGVEKVGTIGPGGSFGELAVLYNLPRQVKVMASGNGELYALDKSVFQEHFANPNMPRTPYDAIGELVESCPIFAPLTIYEKQALAAGCRNDTYSADQVVFTAGDDAVLCVLLSGAVTVTDGEGQISICNRHGQVFGDLAPQQSSTAKVSSSACSVLVLPQATWRYLTPIPTLSDPR
jgi:cAMP-dependent protein kinase regulator